MMDFEGIEKVRQRVRQNGTLAQKLVQLQQAVPPQTGTGGAVLPGSLPVAAAAPNSKHEFAKYSLMDFFRQNIFSDGLFYL